MKESVCKFEKVGEEIHIYLKDENSSSKLIIIKKYGLKYTCLGVHKLWSSQGGLIKGLGVTTL